MSIAGVVAAVWMAFISLFGFGHQGAQSAPSSSTSTPQQQPAPASVAPAAITTASQTQPDSSSAEQSRTQQSSSVAASGAALPEGGPWETTLPLGDYKYTTSAPQQGYIYLCNVQPGGEGAQGTPTWISGDVWYPSEKVAVEGSVSWPDAQYSMTISGSTRIIKSNGEPTDHPTGIFPIQKSDPAYQFDANPNSIEPQNYDFQLPVSPTMLASPDCIYGEVGMLDDGVPLFDGFDAEYRDAVAHETQDQWDGHPDPGGVYHDHGFEEGPVKEPVSTVVGFAFDGYPITGSLLPDGNYLHTADLDECHGITSTIDLDGKEVTMYHYVLTQDFPYSVSCFRGQSYEPKPNGGAQGQGQTQSQTPAQQQNSQTGGAPPQAAIDACANLTSGASCTVENGPSGTCKTPPGQSSLACIPN